MAVDEDGNEIITPQEDNSVQKRITDLSGKVKEAATERDTERARADAEAAKNAELAKERDFYASFSDVVSNHPNAKDHKDEILAKVKAGYDVEDATVSVLNKAGKLMPITAERRSPAGGSAGNAINGGGQKTSGEMSQAERRAALVEAEGRGDIAVS